MDFPTSSPPSPERAFRPLKPLDLALAELLAHAAVLTGGEVVSTFDADGRVLAQDLVSSLDVPGHDNSSMDGYAVRSADWVNPGTSLQVNQRIAAGSVGQALAPLSAARIFTGAAVPDGADAVVMQEDCLAQPDGSLCLATSPVPGQWIRRRGEDVALGSTVLHRGERLTPASLGLAASIGFDRLRVSDRKSVV